MCTFMKLYTVDQIPGRIFGGVFVDAPGGPKNVATALLEEGWAHVSAPAPAPSQSPSPPLG